MKKIFMIIAAGWVIVGSAGVHADDDDSVKTEKGLRFAVPSDWPIEEHGGALAPIPVEEYVVRKFKAIESRLKTIESSLEKKSEDLPGSSAAMKSDSDQPVSEPSEMAGQLEELAKDVAQLKEQSGFLKTAEPDRSSDEKATSDKNIAEQIRLIRARLEDVERRLGVVEFHQDE